jgi:hypothetical protein
MPTARIAGLEFLREQDAPALEPSSASAGLRASLEDGKQSTFQVATADQPGRWVEGEGFTFGAPILFVQRLDEETVAEAAQAMAAEMGGYWLRYYNSPGERVAGQAPAKGKKPAAKRAAKGTGVKVSSVAISEAYPPRSPEHGCAVIQVRIEDGREFSLLTATPSWFTKAFTEMGLRYYYGPSVLFVGRLDEKLVKKAVTTMAAEGDGWLTRHDTPRRTLPEVLADFKARREAAAG